MEVTTYADKLVVPAALLATCHVRDRLYFCWVCPCYSSYV